jgi:hypothetical protein
MNQLENVRSVLFVSIDTAFCNDNDTALLALSRCQVVWGDGRTIFSKVWMHVDVVVAREDTWGRFFEAFLSRNLRTIQSCI